MTYFENAQLLNTISKITALLTRCWGKAGASIIKNCLDTSDDFGDDQASSSLSAITVFDPSSAGRPIYALFAFVEVVDFDRLITVLNEDVVAIINDVAAVVHGEVARWGQGRGECNKNLGNSFLMIWR